MQVLWDGYLNNQLDEIKLFFGLDGVKGVKSGNILQAKKHENCLFGLLQNELY